MPKSAVSALNAPTNFYWRGSERVCSASKRIGWTSGTRDCLRRLGDQSSLYLQTIVHIMGDQFTSRQLSARYPLIFWALIITVSIKYCFFVMRADNQGEGGILALMTITGADWAGRGRALIIMGLFGAALIYGDGIITPAISVLSAVEGLNVATSISNRTRCQLPWSFWSCCLQFSTGERGRWKGLRAGQFIWFATIAVLGVIGIVHHPHVLAR